MRITETIKHGLGKLLRPVHAGDDKLATRRLQRDRAPELVVTSDGFAPNAPIPTRYTQDGENLSPPLRWSSLPPETREVVLLCEDPDAPLPKPYVHWIACGIPPSMTELPEGVARRVPPPVRQLKNSTRQEGWAGPAPPLGHGPHHYHFQVFALSEPLRGFAGSDRDALVDAMRGHILAYGDLVGTYERA
jgi:Raf kinase inhibitor-like YbhB/YbcL family protein